VTVKLPGAPRARSAAQNGAYGVALLELDDVSKHESGRCQKIGGRQPVVPHAVLGYHGQVTVRVLREVEPTPENKVSRHLPQAGYVLRGLFNHAGTLATNGRKSGIRSDPPFSWRKFSDAVPVPFGNSSLLVRLRICIR
jgi:hypothetical protein